MAGECGVRRSDTLAAFVLCLCPALRLPNGACPPVLLLVHTASSCRRARQVVILVAWTPNIVTIEEAALTFAFMLLLVAIAYLADQGYLSRTGAAYASRRLKLLTLRPEDVGSSASAAESSAAGVDEAELSGGGGGGGELPPISTSEITRYLKSLDKPSASGGPLQSIVVEEISVSSSIDRVSAASTLPPISSPSGRVSLPDSPKHSSGGSLISPAELHPSGRGASFAPDLIMSESYPSAAGEAVGQRPLPIAAADRGRPAAVSAALTPEQIAAGLRKEREATRPRTRTEYRQAALRALTGRLKDYRGRALTGGGDRQSPAANGEAALGLDASAVSLSEVPRTCLVGFTAALVTVTEGDDTHAVLSVARQGCREGTLTVQYATSDGTATAPADYEAISGTLVFAPGEALKQLRVPIVDDDEIEDDESFYVALSAPSVDFATAGGGGDAGAATVAATVAASGESIPAAIPGGAARNGGEGRRDVKVRLGGPSLVSSCTVVIKDDDCLPGTLSWQCEQARPAHAPRID